MRECVANINKHVKTDWNRVYAEATEGKRHQGVYKDAVKKNERTLRKSIFSRIAQVELHSEKMANPGAFDSMWQEKEECQKKGLLRKWEKDMIRNAEQASVEIRVWKEHFDNEQ